LKIYSHALFRGPALSPPLFATSFLRLSPPPLSAAALQRRSLPPFPAVDLRRLFVSLCRRRFISLFSSAALCRRFLALMLCVNKTRAHVRIVFLVRVSFGFVRVRVRVQV
jgi:hypothetical protein